MDQLGERMQRLESQLTRCLELLHLAADQPVRRPSQPSSRQRRRDHRDLLIRPPDLLTSAASLRAVTELFGLLRGCAVLTERVLATLTLRPPTGGDGSRRSECVALLVSELKSLLKCSVFVLDSRLLGLEPDEEEEIELSLVLGRAYQSSWALLFVEQLRRRSSSAHERKGRAREVTDPSDQLEGLGGEESPLPVRDVQITPLPVQITSSSSSESSVSAALSFRLLDIPVTVHSRPLPSLCLLALVEELSQWLPEPGLLKNSFLLVKWFLLREVFPAFLRDAPKSDELTLCALVPDEILWLMVLAVFNKFLSRIADPLHCLLLLLVDFATHDLVQSQAQSGDSGGVGLVTIFGVLSLPDELLAAGSGPARFVVPGHHLPVQSLRKFWHLAQGDATRSPWEDLADPAQPNSFVLAVPAQLAAASPREWSSRFLALNPFGPELVQSRELPTDSCSVFAVFHQGLGLFRQMLSLLRHSGDLSRLLPALLPRSSRVATDLPPSSRYSPPPPVIVNPPANLCRPVSQQPIQPVDLEGLVNSLRYCNLIGRDLVSDSALFFAAVESLEMRGALPVGEVGKAICFQADAQLVGRYLKERHGGLKKFLEHFPAVFVFGDDHSFNPHVFLVGRLSPEHAQCRRDNLLPMQILLQYRQVIHPLPPLTLPAC